MKVALAPEYRFWMIALLPTTFGVGTAALWARSLSWPLKVEEDGLTLRYRRKVPWNAIKKINVWRDYVDGHISRIVIYHSRGTSKFPVRGLEDGDIVVKTILASYKQARQRRPIMTADAIAGSRQSDHSYAPQLPRFLVRQ